MKNQTINELTATMDSGQKEIFNQGMETAFRLHFQALKKVDHKVYCLPEDAKALEMEVLEIINGEVDEQTAPDPVMVLSKKPTEGNGKEAVNG